MIKHIFALFIGILVSTSIGLGISAFYPEPKHPEYPVMSTAKTQEGAQITPTELEKQRQFDKDYKVYEIKQRGYARNVGLIAVAISLAILIASLMFMKKLDFIADGILLGGLMTLIYGVLRSFGSGDQKLMFAVTLASLVISLIIGYIKFIAPTQKPKAKR